MRKLILVLFTAFLAVPALAVAGSPPSPADSAAAQKQCRAELTAMAATPGAFKLLYGTNANKSNAFGKCVSKRASANAQNDSNASAQCRSEQSADSAAFAAKYGLGPQHKNAFGRCVSLKAKAAANAQVNATINASKQCFTERQAGLAAFKAKYGAKNSFGKCVSSKVKHSG